MYERLNRCSSAGQVTPPKDPKKAVGPTRAYQFDTTVIVEDEDGDVLTKCEIPNSPKIGEKRSSDKTESGLK